MNRLAPDSFARIGSTPPAARFTVAEVLRDCAAFGLLDELRQALDPEHPAGGAELVRVVRDLVYELAGARNRELAVDVLVHATGLAEFECRSLRDYARRHGMTAEGFRRQVAAMRRRLNLPDPSGDAN